MWYDIADPRYTLTVRLFCRRLLEKPNFAVFGLWHLVLSPMATVWQSWRQKLNTVHNYKPSPIQRHQNRLCTPTPSWRNRAHNLWRSKAWRTDKQTDKKLKVFGHPGGGWNPIATKLGTVIENLELVLAPRKLLAVWRIVSPLGGAENLGITRPRQLKTPITP